MWLPSNQIPPKILQISRSDLCLSTSVIIISVICSPEELYVFEGIKDFS